jgi:uncharacterized protein (TIGR02466 family)
LEGDNFSIIKDDLIKWIYDYKSNKECVIKSNRGGWQSNAYFIQENESFAPFFSYITSLLKNYNTLYTGDVRFGLKNAWINVNPPGTYNISHTHPQSTLSGVLWIKCPEKCGNIVFESPVSHTQQEIMELLNPHIAEKNNYYPTFYIAPTEGTLLLFPSDIRHSVEENLSSEDRISIAFNLEFVRG